jgi:hypothetical protein
MAALGTALGCSQLPIPPHGDGGATDGPPSTMHGPRALTPFRVDAVALAADDSGIYWISPANGLWFLPAGFPIPVPLAPDAKPGPYCCWCTTPPVPAGSSVFWVGSNQSGLHRTRKDGGGDEIAVALPTIGRLAGAAGGVYWTEGTSSNGDGGVIRALAVDAAPGSTPATLVQLGFDQDISSLAAGDDALYWTPYDAVGSTVYTAMLWTAPLGLLANGGAGTALEAFGSPYAATSTDADLLFAFDIDYWTSGIARLPRNGAPQPIATLPRDDSVVGLAAVDAWALASTNPGFGCSATLNLFAVPLAGGAPKLVAQGMRAPAIAAPQGIVFVDADGHLVALAASELATIVSPVP